MPGFFFCYGFKPFYGVASTFPQVHNGHLDNFFIIIIIIIIIITIISLFIQKDRSAKIEGLCWYKPVI